MKKGKVVDLSNGYDAIADSYMSVRSSIGCSVVKDWVKKFKSGDLVADIGAGFGYPFTSILIEHGLSVYAIDASPRLVQVLKQDFPDITSACEAVETSNFFNRSFDGILAVGLIFLLADSAQVELFKRMSKALKPGGRLLFSAPYQACKWRDNLTGRTSLSLGKDEYTRILLANKMTLCATCYDEGRNHYFEALKQYIEFEGCLISSPQKSYTHEKE